MDKWNDVWKLSEVPVDVPDGVSGEWSVSTFSVSKDAEKWGKMRAVISSDRGRYVPAGTYKALKRGGSIVMSNTPDEIRDQYPLFRVARGIVLINGLGLGVTLQVILNKVDEAGEYAVKKAYIVERSEDVLSLVKPTYEKDGRVEFIQADALGFRPPKERFDAVWHDIWDNVCSDNLEQMHTLHRKYARKAAWQGSWCREQCEYQRSRSF
jgi:hypothetical protein